MAISGTPIAGTPISGSDATGVTVTGAVIRRGVRRPRARVISGVTVAAVRTDFHIFIWPLNGVDSFSTLWGGSTDGLAYYNSLGLGFARNFYDVSGAIDVPAATTGVTNSVDYCAAQSEWAFMDIHYMDNEAFGYYSGTSGDTNIVPDTQDLMTAARTEWLTKHPTIFYCGSYGAITGYQVDDTKSQQVSAALDFGAPEMYQGDIYDFRVAGDAFAAKKTSLGITTPLIPMLLRSAATLADDVYTRLMYLYSKPEINGAILWGQDAPAAGPTYYDNTGWMIGLLRFLDRYPLTRGNPF